MAQLYDLGSGLLGAIAAHPVIALVSIAGILIGFLFLARRLGWLAVARQHPRATTAVLVPLLAVGLPVGWYLTSPLVLSASVDEAAPSIATLASPSGPPAVSPISPTPAVSGVPESARPTETPAPPALLTRAGTFHGSDDFHFGRGTARLLEVAPGSYVVRLEDFAVRNGPDLYLYLSPSANGYADGAIEIGRLKADKGNQNYPLPPGGLSDADAVGSVVVWCKQFSHLFATAPLSR